MDVKNETGGSSANTLKLLSSLLLLIAGIVGFYYFSGESVLYRVLGLLFVVALSLLVFYSSGPGHQLWSFFRASRLEVRKVVWPTRGETLQTTMIVLFIVFLVGLFLWLLDSVLAAGFKWLTAMGGG